MRVFLISLGDPTQVFRETLKQFYHHLVDVIAIADCGVTEFMTELDALCWSCCSAVHLEIDRYCFWKANIEPDVIGCILIIWCFKLFCLCSRPRPEKQEFSHKYISLMKKIVAESSSQLLLVLFLFVAISINKMIYKLHIYKCHTCSLVCHYSYIKIFVL